MEPHSAEHQPPSAIRFRPGKKRKAYRQRHDDDQEQEHDAERGRTGPQDAPTGPESAGGAGGLAAGGGGGHDDDDDNDEAAVAAALRLRNARKGRLRGVGFRSDARPDGDGATAGSASRALVLAETEPNASEVVVAGIANRFTHQTGLIGELNDKHMTEYIESRLSSRNAPAAPPDSRGHATDATTVPQPSTGAADAGDGQHQPSQKAPADARPREQPVLLGKLMEVDLQEALRDRDAGGEPRQRGTKRQRLGRDGKPWRPRNRRGSDDIKRDQLVEQLLHENRLDVYDVPSASPAVDAPDEDGAADERLAEQFQKQYMDDMAQRRQRRKPAQPAKPTNEEVLRGPKLGGSRNSRAAMRDLLLKKEKEAKDAKR